jgi:hypothetical protein
LRQKCYDLATKTCECAKWSVSSDAGSEMNLSEVSGDK